MKRVKSHIKSPYPKRRNPLNPLKFIIKPSAVYSDSFYQIQAKELDPTNKIEIDRKDQPTHKYAIRLQKLLERSKPNKNGILTYSIKNPVPVSISKILVSRTINIIDTLLIALEARNLKVKWPKPYKNYFYVSHDNLEISFTICEKLNRVDHKPTKQEKSEQKKFRYYEPPKYDYYLSGKLALRIAAPPYLANIRYNWNDGKKELIENHLNKFIIELYKIVEEHQLQQERERQWKIEREKQRKLDFESEIIRAEQKRKEEYILSGIEHWNTAQNIDQFLKDFKKSCLDRKLSEEQKTLAEEIIHILTQYIQKINPLTSIEEFIHDYKSRYNWLSYF